MPHPITGKDLRTIQDTHNIRGAAICWLLGCSNSFYQDLLKRGPNEDKNLSPAHAIMIRLLLDNPELSPIPSAPEPNEVFEKVKQIDPSYTKKKFAVLMGREPSTGAKLVDSTQETRMITSNYLLALNCSLDNASKGKDKLTALRLFEKMVEDEAEVRGQAASAVWTDGWKPKKV